MIPTYSTNSKSSRDRLQLLIVSLLLSIGLHLVMFLGLPLLDQKEDLVVQKQQPTRVHLVDRPKKQNIPQKQKPAEFEIDQQPPQTQPELPVKSFRKADHSQIVKKEQSPRGNDVRDQTTEAIQKPLKYQTTRSNQEKKPAQENNATEQITPESTIQTEGNIPRPTKPTVQSREKVQVPSLSPEQLRPDIESLEQIVQGSQGDQNRIKDRKDIEIGDTVWLNLQHNLLVSFFRRFHDQIELVWNYPAEAILSETEGTLELLIIVDPKGDLIDIDLVRTSGSDLLDFEAIQAVYRAAPFGPLTKHYPHEQLKIRAHFSYRLSGRYIYGR